MTTYTAIPNTDIDQDSPITQPLMTLLRDNPIAIAEGAANGPVLSSGWHPYDMVDVGDGNDGTFYDFSVDGAVASVETPAFADGYEYAVLGLDLSTSSNSTGNFQIEQYLATSASYDTPDTIVSYGVNAHTLNYRWDFFAWSTSLPRLTSRIHTLQRVSYKTEGPATSAGTEVTGTSTAQKIGKRRFSNSTGNIDAGTLQLFRRREFVTG